MSKLQELIKDLCPNGVVFEELSKYVDYVQPQKYIVSSTNYSDEYNIPVLTPGQTFILGYTNDEDGIYNVEINGPIILFDDFTTSKKWVDFNFKVKSSALKILIPKNENINFRYLYHMMEEIKFDKGEHGRKWISKYSKIKVPIPPLEIQDEIVMILDNFTKVTAELTAELTAREKQFNHYRSYLLTEENDVHEVRLSDIFEIQGGYTPSKSKSEFWNNGTIPWFRMEDIRKNGRILENSIQHITDEGARKIFDKNSIILATTATIGEHALITTSFVANQQFTIFTLKEEAKTMIKIEYLYYYFFLIGEECKLNQSMSSFPSVKMSWLKSKKIKIPSLDKQNNIISILDKFSNLTTDLNKGLPAEIQARQKQYEYYRNKLLTFKEL